MQTRHTPVIGPPYWLALLAASVAGTNLGDLYAHVSGLGLGAGLAVLAAAAGAILVAELRDRLTHGVWFWALMMIIRTGATNIAYSLSYGLRVSALPPVVLVVVLVVVMALAAAGTRWALAPAPGEDSWQPRLTAGLVFWLAMLAAGVLGTVLGDALSLAFGEATGAGALLVFWVLTLVVWHRGQRLGFYWLAVVVACMTGTCLGGWLTQSEMLGLGLSIASLLTGGAYLVLITLIELTGADFASPHAEELD